MLFYYVHKLNRRELYACEFYKAVHNSTTMHKSLLWALMGTQLCSFSFLSHSRVKTVSTWIYQRFKGFHNHSSLEIKELTRCFFSFGRTSQLKKKETKNKTEKTHLCPIIQMSAKGDQDKSRWGKVSLGPITELLGTSVWPASDSSTKCTQPSIGGAFCPGMVEVIRKKQH